MCVHVLLGEGKKLAEVAEREWRSLEIWNRGIRFHISLSQASSLRERAPPSTAKKKQLIIIKIIINTTTNIAVIVAQ